MSSDSYARLVADRSLRIGSIKLNPAFPFKWASGYFMPIYNDNRMNLYSPRNTELIVRGFSNLLDTMTFEAFAGTSTAGIPWSAMLAREYKMPMTYVRDKPKDHGLKNRIEGLDTDKDYEGAKVVLIEDLVSTGGSSVSAVQAVRDAHGDIDNCLSIFSYGFDEAERMFMGNVPYGKDGERLRKPCILTPLLTYGTLIDVAIETRYINEAQAKLLEEWRADPFGWGTKHGFPPVKK